MNEVQDSDSILSRNAKPARASTCQLITPISLAYRSEALECYFIPNQELTLFIINGRNAFFSVQDRLKFTRETLDEINPRFVTRIYLQIL